MDPGLQVQHNQINLLKRYPINSSDPAHITEPTHIHLTELPLNIKPHSCNVGFKVNEAIFSDVVFFYLSFKPVKPFCRIVCPRRPLLIWKSFLLFLQLFYPTEKENNENTSVKIFGYSRLALYTILRRKNIQGYSKLLQRMNEKTRDSTPSMIS